MSAPDPSSSQAWAFLPSLWHKWRHPATHHGEVTQEQRADRWIGRYPLRVGLAVVAIALSGLLVITLLSDRLRVRDEATKSIHNVCLAVREHLLQIFAESDRLLFATKDAATSALINPQQTSELDAFFKTVRLPPYLLTLAVSDTDGTVQKALGPLNQGGKDLLRSYLSDKHPVEDTAMVSPLLQLPFSETQTLGQGLAQGGVIFTSRPLYDTQGRHLGWISAAIKPEFFGSFFRAMELGVGGMVQVVRLDGSILIRTPYHGGGRPQGPRAAANVVSLLQHADYGQFDGIDPVDGVDRLYAYDTMKAVPFAVVVGVAKEDVYGDWTRRALLLGLFGMLAMVVIALLARQLGLYLEAVQASRLRYRSAEEHLSQAQALAHLGSWQWVLPTNRMWWSAEMKHLCGLSAHDANRLPSYDLFLALVYPTDRARVAITIGQALEDGQSFELDHRLLLADGTVRHVHQEGQCVLGENGEVYHLDCVLQDVTQAAELHAQLADAAKLSTLGEMASGMAHELSQPLNIIHMTAEGALLDLDSMAEQTRTDPSSPFAALRDAVQRIAGQAGRMGQVLDHIRIFSRRDSGPAEIFDAAQVVRRTLNSLEASFSECGVALHGSLTPDLQAPVMGHSVQLEQVLMNLLMNGKEAVLAALADGSRPAYGGWITLSAQRMGSDLQILVHDSGNGVPENQLDRLFEPFFTTKDAGAGPGLGLSVAYGIISAMGGKLAAQNSPQGGALFELRVPLQLRALPSASKQAPEPLAPTPAVSNLADRSHANGDPLRTPRAQGGNDIDRHHLLFLERTPGALMAMRMHLARKGFLTSTAETLSETEAIVRSHPLSLIITDHLVASHHDGALCPMMLATLQAIDPQLPILGLAPNHPLPVAPGGIIDDSDGSENDKKGVHIIRHALSMGDLCEMVHTIQRHSL
jgi:signal transduction histidine kinase